MITGQATPSRIVSRTRSDWLRHPAPTRSSTSGSMATRRSCCTRSDRGKSSSATGICGRARPAKPGLGHGMFSCSRRWPVRDGLSRGPRQPGADLIAQVSLSHDHGDLRGSVHRGNAVELHRACLLEVVEGPKFVAGVAELVEDHDIIWPQSRRELDEGIERRAA